MQDVQLVEPHRVQRASQRVQGDEVPDRVDHQAAPWKARLVLDCGHVDGPLGTELDQGGQTRQGTPLGGRGDANTVVDGHPVRVAV